MSKAMNACDDNGCGFCSQNIDALGVLLAERDREREAELTRLRAACEAKDAAMVKIRQRLEKLNGLTITHENFVVGHSYILNNHDEMMLIDAALTQSRPEEKKGSGEA
jgi:hypothetical protein